MNRLKLALLLLVVSTWGCVKNNNCDTVIQGESFALTDSTKVYLSNYFNHERIIFEDVTSGEETVFTVDKAVDTTLEYRTVTECVDNPDLSSQLRGDAEVREVQLRNDSDGLIITIQHRAALAFAENSNSIEEIFVLEGELNNSGQLPSANSGFLVLTPTLNDPLFSNKVDTLSFTSREFYDVYEINPANTGYESSFLNQNLSIKYSKLDGIVYIGNSVSGVEIIFKRVE